MRIIVTGGNSGIGKATATALAAAGHSVVIACRTIPKAEQAAAEMAGDVEVRHLDLADLSSVRKFADSVDSVDVLVNNAGVMGQTLPRTADGFEAHMGTNYLGHFALTCLLGTKIKDRVISVGSASYQFGRLRLDDLNGHARERSMWPAYASSKLAIMLFIDELARRGIRAYVADPGGGDTDITRGASGLWKWWVDGNFAWFLGQEPALAARSIVLAVTTELPSGTYIAPRSFKLVGTPRETKTLKKARNPVMAHRLWELSAELTGCDWTAHPDRMDGELESREALMNVTEPAVSRNNVEFDPLSHDFFNAPFNTYRRLRDEAPVYHNEKYGFWALSRYQDVEPALKDCETYSSARGITLDMYLAEPDPAQPPMIIMMDPPDHTVMRKLVNKVFTPRAIADLESMIREKITEAANALSGMAFDVVADFGAIFPVEIISTMLGVPPGDRQQVRLWSDKQLERSPGDFHLPPEGAEAAEAITTFYYELVCERRANPQDDMISRLTQVDVIRDGGVAKLSDLEIAAFAMMLGGAGAETVVKLVGNAAVTFAANPDQWRKLRVDRSKIPGAFEELLRYEAPSQYQLRYSTRDVTLHGSTIPAGSIVMLINGSATRDERAFADADRFDIDRKPSGHNLNFGYGVHSCLGAALARMEGRIALDVMLDLMPDYEVETAGLRRVAMANVAGWSNVPIHVIR
jgi:cytochrome P450/NAD(P)-dependent dehydrogenase (short-subunit alcohol dehydrogenase family)